MSQNIIQRSKGLINSVPLLKTVLIKLRNKIRVYKSLRRTHFSLNCSGRLIKDIIGIDNKVVIKNGTSLNSLTLRIRGNQNILEVEEDCSFGTQCSIWIEGNGIQIKIGKGSTFVTRCHINAQEDKSEIIIGSDCMFSNHIIVRTSDSHPIYDTITGQRINMPDKVIVGNHVWIAPNTKIMKGAVIGNDSVIGSDTTVSKKFEENNVLIVGRPAKIVRKNINWTREKLF